MHVTTWTISLYTFNLGLFDVAFVFLHFSKDYLVKMQFLENVSRKIFFLIRPLSTISKNIFLLFSNKIRY